MQFSQDNIDIDFEEEQDAQNILKFSEANDLTEINMVTSDSKQKQSSRQKSVPI